jgi:hypothetical protein
VRLRAYIEAYRALPTLAADVDLGEWLADLVARQPAGSGGSQPDPDDLWDALAGALVSEAPALAPPEPPERRFPVIPRLQRRRRLQGPR